MHSMGLNILKPYLHLNWGRRSGTSLSKVNLKRSSNKPIGGMFYHTRAPKIGVRKQIHGNCHRSVVKS